MNVADWPPCRRKQQAPPNRWYSEPIQMVPYPRQQAQRFTAQCTIKTRISKCWRQATGYITYKSGARKRQKHFNNMNCLILSPSGSLLDEACWPGTKLTILLHLLVRLRMSEAITSNPHTPHCSILNYRKNFTFKNRRKLWKRLIQQISQQR